MELAYYENILQSFGLDAAQYGCEKIGTGHIHVSLKITPKNANTDQQSFVLQHINTEIFKHPELIASNWKRVAKYLTAQYPNYRFLNFIPTKNNTDFSVVECNEKKQYWRLLPFIENGYVNDRADSLDQIRRAAFAFGNFTKMMHACPVEDFHEVLENFHDSAFRWQQFHEALDKACNERILRSKDAIDALKSSRWIVEKAAELQQKLPKRIQHMDAKVGNLLFVDSSEQKTYLLDLDTMMPATFLSDAGDLIRSMATDAKEDEADETKIILFPERIEAIREGYFAAAETILSEEEKQQFYFAGFMLVQMQASRFLTDYLMGDVYYSVQYETHNLVRTENQLCLLNKLILEYA